MLKIEILKDGRFTTSGSSALAMMQNKSLPSLDLIVRESIQNSLDAALPESKTNVIMHFRCGEFDGFRLANHFELIGEKLKHRFSGQQCEFLSIMDTNTIGLTGDLSGHFKVGEKGQNLGKLVFSIMRAQDKEGAGGSWGIGKTVYYRIGVGLVIYYSRVKLDNGSFQERLVAGFVEDETNPNGLLSFEDDSLGVAFFGDQDPEKPDEIQAITDGNRIHDFLSIFGIVPFTGTQTGTNIIIPYVDPSSLLNNSFEEGEAKKWWQDDLEQYLKVSILRWYFPRLSSGYPNSYGPKFTCLINGTRLEPDKETPIFTKLQELYNACYSSEYPAWIKKVPIERSRGNFEDYVLGWLTLGKVTAKELSILDKHLPTPFEYCMAENHSGEKNSPIIAFVRKPGMVVNYETSSNDIVGSISSSPDEYIIGVFSLNSANRITRPISLNLDEYIRKSEKSDHTSWTDYEVTEGSRKIRIVGFINGEIKKTLYNSFEEQKPTTREASTNINFARKFGKLLLPDESFGHAGSGRTGQVNGGRGGGGQLRTAKQNTVAFSEHSYGPDGLALEYKFSLKKDVKRIVGIGYVNSLTGPISPEKYEESGLAYPFDITTALGRITAYEGENAKQLKLTFFKDNDEFKEFKFKYLKTQSGKIYGFEFDKTNDDKFIPVDFIFRFVLTSADPLVQVHFKIKIEEED